MGLRSLPSKWRHGYASPPVYLICAKRGISAKRVPTAVSTLGILGGLDKRALAQDRESIDRELDQAKRMLPIGGYVPEHEHNVPPDVPWENYKHFTNRLRELVGA